MSFERLVSCRPSVYPESSDLVYLNVLSSGCSEKSYNIKYPFRSFSPNVIRFKLHSAWRK